MFKRHSDEEADQYLNITYNRMIKSNQEKNKRNTENKQILE